jgi:hypothetical protein
MNEEAPTAALALAADSLAMTPIEHDPSIRCKRPKHNDVDVKKVLRKLRLSPLLVMDLQPEARREPV